MSLEIIKVVDTLRTEEIKYILENLPIKISDSNDFNNVEFDKSQNNRIIEFTSENVSTIKKLLICIIQYENKDLNTLILQLIEDAEDNVALEKAGIDNKTVASMGLAFILFLGSFTHSQHLANQNARSLQKIMKAIEINKEHNEQIEELKIEVSQLTETLKDHSISIE